MNTIYEPTHTNDWLGQLLQIPPLAAVIIIIAL